MKTEVDHDRLTKLWTTYINDSSLFTKQRFGTYLHTRIMKPGWCWPSLFYANNGQAYDMVWRHIHRKDDTGIRRVQ